MVNKVEYQKLLEKLILLKQSYFGSENDYFNDLRKNFTKRELKILKEGNALPINFELED